MYLILRRLFKSFLLFDVFLAFFSKYYKLFNHVSIISNVLGEFTMGLLNRIITERYNQPRTISELKEINTGDIGARVKCYIDFVDLSYYPDSKDERTSYVSFVIINKTLDERMHAEFSGRMSLKDYNKMKRCFGETKRPKEYAFTGIYHADKGWFKVEAIKSGNNVIFPDHVEYRKK